MTWSVGPSVHLDTDVEGSKCAIGPDTGNGGSGSGIVFGSSSWTVVVRGRMDTTTGSILLCLGNPMGTGSSDSSVSLTYEGSGKIGLSPCTNGSKGTRATTYQYEVADATTAFHTYALQYTHNTTASKRMLAVYVDGVKLGEFARDMTAKNYATFTFFGTPTKTAGISTFALGATTMTSAVSDFRVYQRLLTEDELKTLSNPPLDEIGCRPIVWNAFNGSFDAEPASFYPNLPLSVETTTLPYAEGRDGLPETALAAGGSASAGGAPWGANTGTEGGDWTVVLDLKGEDVENAVYFATGDGAAGSCFGLCSGGAGKVKLVKYSKAGAFGVCCSCDVADASSAFHQYAIVRSGSYIKLYIDGVYAGQENRDENPRHNRISLFKSPGGNGANGLLNASSSILDDFRIYRRALTPEELDAIRTPAHDESGLTPVHWYKFDGSLASSGRRALDLEDAFADAVFEDGKAIVATGDKPYGTNIAWRADNWTILLKARSTDTDNAAIATFGSSLSTASSSFSLTSSGAGKVSFSGFGGGAAHADLITADVADASSAFHSYAIVRDGTNVAFWVDGGCVGQIVRPNDPTYNGIAFFGVHDGIGNSKLVVPASGAAIADFRLYDRTLTARELAAAAEAEDIVTTAHWTGAAGNKTLADSANWACTNAVGEEVAGAVPGAASSVFFTGNVEVDLPASTTLAWHSLAFDCTLTSDCDWSALATEAIHGKIDLAGNDLTLAGLDGTGIITDSSATGGTLTLAIGSGKTAESETMRLAGSLKLAKTGAGTYVAPRAQTYTGGTEIAAGVAKFGTAGTTLPFGASGSTIAVGADGELDANGNIDEYVYDVRLDGGTLANRGADIAMGSAAFGNVSLTADSTAVLDGSLSLHAANEAVTALDLAGHTLTVSVEDGKVFRLYNCDVTVGNVTLVPSSTGSVLTLTLANGVRASAANFDLTGTLAPYAASTVGGLTLRSDCLYQSVTPYVTSVAGTFTPFSEEFQNIELLDGATLCLSNVTGTFSTVNASHSDRAVTFANGATVKIDISGRTDLKTLAETVVDGSVGGYLLTWNDSPTNVTFALDTASSCKYKLSQTAAGLRLLKRKGLSVIVK